MGIGGVDFKESKRLQKRSARQAEESQRLPTAMLQSPRMKVRRTATTTDTDSNAIASAPAATSSSSDFEVSKHLKTLTKSSFSTVTVEQKLPKTLPNFARALDRRGISSRAGAQIASALLQDFGVVNSSDSSAVIDKSKLQRERSKSRHRAVSATHTSELLALYYDGRKDETLTKEIVDGKAHRKKITEEHISMVEEPGSIYVGHVTPASGTGADISKAIRDFAKNSQINLSALKAMGCDGTAANTDKDRGCVKKTEEALQKNLQVVVCLLHLNELPLRKLIIKLDGPTSGPNSLSEPIGKSLKKCEEEPVVQYAKIECSPLPEVDQSDLSTDQKYLREIWEAVTSGICPERLAVRDHKRWAALE